MVQQKKSDFVKFVQVRSTAAPQRLRCQRDRNNRFKLTRPLWEGTMGSLRASALPPSTFKARRRSKFVVVCVVVAASLVVLPGNPENTRINSVDLKPRRSL